jgi:hypothetical protein
LDKPRLSFVDALFWTRINQTHERAVAADPPHQGNDYFADTILERFPRIAALVSVLSPRYVHSEWCTRELKAFCSASAGSGGVRVAALTYRAPLPGTTLQLIVNNLFDQSYGDPGRDDRFSRGTAAGEDGLLQIDLFFGTPERACQGSGNS